MTRFARAKGSKSSNEKKPEEATSWSEMKNAMLSKNESKSEEKQTPEKKKVRTDDEQKKTEWASLGDDTSDESVSRVKKHMSQKIDSSEETKKEKKKKKKSKNFETELQSEEKSKSEKEAKKSEIIPDEVESEVKMKRKKRELKETEDDSEVLILKEKKRELKKTEDDSEVLILKEKKRVLKETEKDSDVVFLKEKKRKLSKKKKDSELIPKKKKRELKKTEEDLQVVTPKKKKRELKETEEDSQVVTPKKKKRELKETEEDSQVVTPKKKKRESKETEEDSQVVTPKKKNKLLKTGVLSTSEESEISGDEEMKNKKPEKNDENKKFMKKKDTKSKHMKNDNKGYFSPKTQQKVETEKEKVEKKFKKRNFQERDSLVEELIINGEKIPITKFQGFYVTLEDAERLKKLRTDMIKQGIPKAKIESAIKLERRRAEKSLSRLKKSVCFHCRGHGHLLSNCPKLLEKENTGTGICYKCGSTEHSATECKVVRGTKYEFAECFICKEQGHIARQCPDNPRGLYPQGGACRECGDVTHLRKDCPKIQAQKAEEVVTVGLRSDRDLECLDEEIADREKQNLKKKEKRNSTVKF